MDSVTGKVFPETNISHPRVVGKMSFLFLWWDMLVPWRVHVQNHSLRLPHLRRRKKKQASHPWLLIYCCTAGCCIVSQPFFSPESHLGLLQAKRRAGFKHVLYSSPFFGTSLMLAIGVSMVFLFPFSKNKSFPPVFFHREPPQNKKQNKNNSNVPWHILGERLIPLLAPLS